MMALDAVALVYAAVAGWRLRRDRAGLAALAGVAMALGWVRASGLGPLDRVMLTVSVAVAYHFLAWRSINPDVKRHVYAMALWFAWGLLAGSRAVLALPIGLGAAALLRHADRARIYRDWRTFVLAGLAAAALLAGWPAAERAGLLPGWLRAPMVR